MCIFCKIAAGEIPAEKVIDEENFMVIKDISPQAKKHYLIIPKKHYADITELSTQNPILLAEMISKFCAQSEALGLSGGFRLITNNGKDACQSVMHVHIHALGGEGLAPRMG